MNACHGTGYMHSFSAKGGRTYMDMRIHMHTYKYTSLHMNIIHEPILQGDEGGMEGGVQSGEPRGYGCS